MTTVTFTKGISDWRIYQQTNGYADIKVEGVTVKTEGRKLYIRVVNEDDCSFVMDWTVFPVTEDENGGKFSATLHLPAGGLYRVDTTLAGGFGSIEWSSIGQKVYHIGVGDLFVITGQSNSTGYGKTPINDPPEMGVHMCRSNEEWTVATHPLNDPFGTKHPANAEPCSNQSPYLAFAKMMKKHLGYPIGLIPEALGGSPISSWVKSVNGYLYNSMIDSVRRITDGDMHVAGILWYQGCSDCDENNAPLYYKRFTEMVNDMRTDFKDENLPIYTVQLNKLNPGENFYWSKIREIQRKAAKEIKNVFVIPSIGLCLNDGIHNSAGTNVVLGERMARLALQGFYHVPTVRNAFAPDIEKATYENKCVTLEFSNVNHYINLLDVPANECDFTVTDDSGNAEIVGYTSSLNKIFLTTARELSGKILVSYIKGSKNRSDVPTDLGSGLSILAFDNFEVTK